MKRFLPLILGAALFCQCSRPVSTSAPSAVADEAPARSSFVASVDSLFLKYQNYDRNSLAKENLISGLAAVGEAYVGGPSPLEGVAFSFERIIKNPQTGEVSALFQSSGLHAPSIEEEPGFATISEPLCVGALGILSEEEALKLETGVDYFLSGTVHAFDVNDVFNLQYGSTPFCGMFVLDDMKVSR